MMTRTTLALFVWLFALTHAHAQRLVADTALEIELEARDPVLDGHGPSRSFAYGVRFDSRLHVWAASKEFDPILRVTDSDGKLLAEDDDSGGGTTAYIVLAVSRDERPSIVVAGKTPASSGKLVVHLSEAPRSEAARCAFGTGEAHERRAAGEGYRRTSSDARGD